MKKELHKADTRGVAEAGWLSSRFSFSFADYHNPARMGFGALRVLNDDRIAAGKGFGMHEHRDMEIISIPLVGKLMHKDSLGNSLTIGPGQVQVMSAGTGVTHSEMNPSKDVDGEFLQIWITTRRKGIAPSHAHATFPASEQAGKWVTLVQPDNAHTALAAPASGLAIHQDAYISRGTFAPGTSRYDLKHEGSGVYVFVISGSVIIDGQLLGHRDALGISDSTFVSLEVTSPNVADLLLIEVPML